MKKVKFGMEWKCYGHQEVELPDNVDPNDSEAIAEYLKSIWNSIPVPEGEYVSGSDTLDPEYLEVIEETIEI